MDLALNHTIIPLDTALDTAIGQKRPFALAFSGGGDSTALLHALARYSPQVFIVDHGLRAGSKAEAHGAKRFAQSLGLSCEILTWTPPAMTGALQAKARIARYGLLGRACRARGISTLLTGHTEDDQAEGVLMRLKGSSQEAWRGAAGMRGLTPAPVWPELAGIGVCRPLLGVSRADIRRYLAFHELPFVDDPSNKNMEFSRIRARRELAAHPALRRDMLALARDMQAARQMESSRILKELSHAAVDEFGVISLPQPVSAKALALLISAASGQASTDMAAATRLNKRMRQTDFTAATLGGARVEANVSDERRSFIITRDPVMATGRAGKPALEGRYAFQSTLWDGRFWIEGGHSVEPAIGKLGALPRALKAALKSCPAQARPTLPYVTKKDVTKKNAGQNDTLIAVGPYSPDGQLSPVVKCAISQRLKRDLSAPWVNAALSSHNPEET